MKWVCSAGGPLILLHQSSLSAWRGVAGDDYGRACEVADWIDVLSVADVDALVIGDEPLRATWMELPGLIGGLIRWGAAPDEASLLCRAEQLVQDAQGWDARRLFRSLGGTYYLFDSATPALADEPASNVLAIELPAGLLSTGSLYVKDDARRVWVGVVGLWFESRTAS